MSADASSKSAQAVTLCSLSGGLIGCSDEGVKSSGQPSFYRSMATTDAQLDAKAAASMISGYRRNNGLGLVLLDDKLMRMAQEQARALFNQANDMKFSGLAPIGLARQFKSLAREASHGQSGSLLGCDLMGEAKVLAAEIGRAHV